MIMIKLIVCNCCCFCRSILYLCACWLNNRVANYKSSTSAKRLKSHKREEKRKSNAPSVAKRHS